MKKLFIGLLIIAAGTTVYFFVIKKNVLTSASDKELLIGQWKLQSSGFARDSSNHSFASALDSLLLSSRYEFTTDGNVTITSTDSSEADTSRYEWNNGRQLFVKESPSDSTGETFQVHTLTKDSLVVFSKDSTKLIFVKRL